MMYSHDFDIRILLPAHKEALLQFARQKLAQTGSDEMEQEMNSWSARWRPEALDHYLSMGWSYATFEKEALTSFILAQPLLFYRGWTQTLWIEDLMWTELAQAKALVDTAYRWAKDKRFQVVLSELRPEWRELLATHPQARMLEASWIELKSSKV